MQFLHRHQDERNLVTGPVASLVSLRRVQRSTSLYCAFGSEQLMACNPVLVTKDIGAFTGFQHCIKLAPDAVPNAIKMCQVPYAIEGKVADAVRLLDEQGIWEKADKGDWVHPLVTPAKSDGTVQVTTDLSHLNKYVILACYPLPTLPEVFQKVRGSAFLSTFDLMKAYHHIELHPKSRPLMLTMTPLGP